MIPCTTHYFGYVYIFIHKYTKKIKSCYGNNILILQLAALRPIQVKCLAYLGQGSKDLAGIVSIMKNVGVV